MPLNLPLPELDPSTSTLYLDWVRSRAPEREPQALDLMDQLDERMRGRRREHKYLAAYMQARLTKAGLPVSHLPWLCDTAGHRLLTLPDQGRNAAAVYVRARELESEHGLALDPHHTVENALLFARHGVLPASEVKAHRRRLSTLYSAEDAHREFVRFLDAWAAGDTEAASRVHFPHNRASIGVAPPADLATQVRASVKALGLAKGPSAEETSRVLGRYLASARGNPVPDGLLQQAENVFAKAPPSPEHQSGLVCLFPTSVTDGAAWLRLLESTGIADAMAQGRVRPEGGYSAWLSEFHHMYAHVWVGGAVDKQELPEKLFTLLSRLVPRIRAEEIPVRLREGRYRHDRVNGRLLIACDDHGIRVDAPEERTAPIRKAVHRVRNPRKVPSPDLVGKVEQRLGALRTVPLGEVEHVLAELDLELTHLVMGGMNGLQEALDGIDLVEPLARTLRFGIPAEYTWPAFEEAVTEIGDRPGGVSGMTSTWPVLTVHGRDAAVAVDHRGRRGSCVFTLPEKSGRHTVHYVGGDFLVSWVPQGTNDDRDMEGTRAFWCSAPDDVFDARSDSALFHYGSAHCYDLGLVLESPGGGRYDRRGILRPGDRTGVTYAHDHATDGTRIWAEGNQWYGGATELDPETGAALAHSSPEFLTPSPDLDYVDLLDTRLHLVRLPEGVADSPLGARDGLAGARVVRIGPGAEDSRKTDRALESTDGRRAVFKSHRDLTYWGVLRMPDNPVEGLLAYRWQAGHTVLQCRDATDDTLLWETWAYPKGGVDNLDLVGRRPLMPPPAYWHFLTPRDPVSTRALRRVETETARELVDAALSAPVPEDPAPAVALPEVAEQAARARGTAVRSALARVLPEVEDPTVVEGVVWAVLWAADLRLRVARMCDRTARVCSGTLPRPADETSDRDLSEALSGLVPPKTFVFGSPLLPGMVTAITADGARLDGHVDEVDRRLGPPGAPAASWTHFFGLLDAAVWRLATGSLDTKQREALTVLLRTWADQPFAEQGTGWVVGTADGAALAPLLAEGSAVVTDPPLREQRFANAPAPHWSGRYLPRTRYTYVRPETVPAPEGAEEGEPLRNEHDEAGRLRGFLELLDRNGPVVVEPEAVKTFRKHTRVMGPLAEFVLSGQAGWPGMVPPKSKGAQTEYRKTGATLSGPDTARLLGAAVPDGPADLWRPGGTVEAAERMARVWVELLGVRPTEPRVTQH